MLRFLFFLLLFFLPELGFELRTSHLVGSDCHLSHGSSPFNFSYFSDRVSSFGAGWPQIIILCMPLHSLDYRLRPPHLADLLRWGLANILSWLALNCSPPSCCLLSSWDYIHELPRPAIEIFDMFLCTINFYCCLLTLSPEYLIPALKAGHLSTTSYFPGCA
jgi:hypothetical protein